MLHQAGFAQMMISKRIGLGYLVDLRIPWVTIGHFDDESSEFLEDDVAHALTQRLKVISCVGETLEQREAGTTLAVVSEQTRAIAAKISNRDNIVLAYEPVWASETGRVATPAQFQEVHANLRKWIQDNVSAEVHICKNYICRFCERRKLQRIGCTAQMLMDFWLAVLPSRSMLI